MGCPSTQPAITLCMWYLLFFVDKGNIHLNNDSDKWRRPRRRNDDLMSSKTDYQSFWYCMARKHYRALGVINLSEKSDLNLDLKTVMSTTFLNCLKTYKLPHVDVAEGSLPNASWTRMVRWLVKTAHLNTLEGPVPRVHRDMKAIQWYQEKSVDQVHKLRVFVHCAIFTSLIFREAGLSEKMSSRCLLLMLLLLVGKKCDPRGSVSSTPHHSAERCSCKVSPSNHVLLFVTANNWTHFSVIVRL